SARIPAAAALAFAVPRAVVVPRIAVRHALRLQQPERAVASRAGPLPAHSRRAAHGADRADACVRRGAARRPRAPADAAAAPAGVVAGVADVAAPAGAHPAALGRYDAARPPPAPDCPPHPGPRAPAPPAP